MMRDVHQAHIKMWWDGNRTMTRLDVNMLGDGRRTKVQISRNFIKRVIK